VWFSLLALLVYYALFRLPFWFPPRQRLTSASYAFGFNNGVAILAVAVLLGAVTLLCLARPGGVSEPRIVFPRDPLPGGRRVLMAVSALAALLYAGLTFAMYIYNGHSAPWLMWETRHLLHRAWLMEVYGLHPYTEFQAAYGPLLTYAPVYVHLLLKPFGASLEQAYFACHLLLNLAGLGCVYYVLSRAIMPARGRVVTFLILAVAGFAPYMGLGGVLVRYFFPFASLLLGRGAVIWMLSRRDYAGYWVGAVTILLLLIVNILLSPEVGAAFALAWLGYAVLTVRCEVRILAVSLIVLMAAALLCWLVLPAPYYWTLLRTSEGANNLPLLPAPHLLLYILTLFLIVPPLLAASLRKRPPGGLPDAAICGALALLCVLLAPGALGRCDPPHVLFYGMGASMLLMIRLANISRRAFTAYGIAYAGVFIVLMQVINLQVFYNIPPRMLLSPHVVVSVAQKLRAATGPAHFDMATLSALNRYPRLGLPFASYEDPAVERYVLSRHQLQPEYYVSVLNVDSASDLERKLRDVGKTEYLLMPRWFASRPSPDPCAEYRKSLQEWFLYSAKLPCRAEPLDPLSSVRSFIADHYIPVEQVGSWLVLRRTGSASTLPHDQGSGTTVAKRRRRAEGYRLRTGKDDIESLVPIGPRPALGDLPSLHPAGNSLISSTCCSVRFIHHQLWPNILRTTTIYEKVSQ
jgi:hypothetical protein